MSAGGNEGVPVSGRRTKRVWAVASCDRHWAVRIDQLRRAVLMYRLIKQDHAYGTPNKVGRKICVPTIHAESSGSGPLGPCNIESNLPTTPDRFLL